MVSAAKTRLGTSTRRSAARGQHRGVVFTPPGLARHVIERLPTDLGGAGLLDPACGDGALLVAAAERGIEGALLHGIEIDATSAASASSRLRAAGVDPLPGGTIRTGDALDPDVDWPARTWIVANPPWSSLSGRHASPDREPAGRPDGVRGGWPSLHGAFLNRIARHVAEQETGALVLAPASVTELERYGELREAVTANACLAGPPEELGEGAFPGVIGPAVLIRLAPRPEGARRSRAPWTTRPPETIEWLAELARFPRLGRRAFGDPGVHTGNAAKELVRGADGPGAPLYQGRDLRPFQLGPASARLREDLRPGDGLRFRIGTRERYVDVPVLVRQTANRPMAALHTNPSYFRNSLLAGYDVPGLDPAFTVAVLNGPVATAWHRAQFRDARQRTFPQVKVAHLAAQPFPIAHRDENPPLHDELAARVRSLEPDDSEGERAICVLALEAFGLPEAARRLALELAGGD